MTRNKKPKREIDAAKHHAALAQADGGSQYEYDPTLATEDCRKTGVRHMSGVFICYACQYKPKNNGMPHSWGSGKVCTELYLSKDNKTYRAVFNAQQCNQCNRQMTRRKAVDDYDLMDFSESFDEYDKLYDEVDRSEINNRHEPRYRETIRSSFDDDEPPYDGMDHSETIDNDFEPRYREMDRRETDDEDELRYQEMTRRRTTDHSEPHYQKAKRKMTTDHYEPKYVYYEKSHDFDGAEFHPAVAQVAGYRYKYDKFLAADESVRIGARSIVGHFTCNNCQPTIHDGYRIWYSAVICTELYLSPHNYYRAIMHAQQCKKCDQYAKPEVDIENYICKVISTLDLWTGRRDAYWSEEYRVTRGPHDEDRCHGCQVGVCVRDS
ncbi:hypothetical protein EC957_011731 [Mortierella hygrophila]|uniref:3CxxC-type domain-containing protein n=1 Tax=Mortierella hygrophila TaxID=979708 RepID=A0A9P6F915_9FUNG|nr:hypothetical protein EC957_011731 [Mortierella hygrophila]